jgi:hypothetical protein
VNPRVLPILGAALTLFAILDLLRRRQLREKYAVLWLGVSLFVGLFAAFPTVLTRLSRFAGVKTPINLLFFVAALVLLVVCVQLSYEISRLEDETRALAEEVGILRLELGSRRSGPAGEEAPAGS